MNFFGHALLASRRRSDPGFVLGSMLLDLAPMAGLRVRSVDDPDIEAGRVHHVETDAAFHATAQFRRLQRESAQALRAAGVRRGPALGVAHAGIELLLDGWLADRHGVPDVYRTALEESHALGVRIRWRTRATSLPFRQLCERLVEAPIPQAYERADFVTERLVRILARHPRLTLDPGEHARVLAWAREARREIGRVGDVLLSETEQALATRS